MNRQSISVPRTGRCSGRSTSSGRSAFTTSGYLQGHRNASFPGTDRLLYFLARTDQQPIQMAAKKEPGVSWRHTTVLVRADIFESAREQGLDISDTCNQALADLLGIDYRQQRLDDVPIPPPVIIAKDGGLPAPALPAPASHPTPRPPVINADDPTAAGAIARGRKLGVKKPVPDTTSRTRKPS